MCQEAGGRELRYHFPPVCCQPRLQPSAFLPFRSSPWLPGEWSTRQLLWDTYSCGRGHQQTQSPHFPATGLCQG